MNNSIKCIAADMGASSARLYMGTYNGRRLQIEEIHRYANNPVKVNSTIYWDVLKLFFELNKGLDKALNKYKNIMSIGIDAWGNDFGLLDKRGRLLENPIHYRDEQSVGMMEKVFSIIPKKEIFSITGIQFMRFNALYHIYSMIYDKRPIVDIAYSLLTIPDLFIYFLTGEMICEYTNASTTQMFNPKKNDWAREIIGSLGIPERLFRNIVQPGTSIGPLKKQLVNCLNDPKIISVAQHDTASAVVAVPTKEKDFIYISSGTWSLVGTETQKPIINDKTFKHNFTNEGGVFGTNRLLKNVTGLFIVQECKRYWDSQGKKYTYAKLEDMAWKAQSFKAFIDPDNMVFAKPGDMPKKIVEFCSETGQRVPINEGEIIRCIIESLALKYKNVIELIEEITGKTYSIIHIVGGGAKDKMLCAFTAQACNKKVIAGPLEATSVGNLIMQIATIEKITNIKEIRKIVIESFDFDTYEDKAKSNWHEAYCEFNKILLLSQEFNKDKDI